MQTVIVDYGAGNLRSLTNSLKALGEEPVLAEGPGDFAKAGRLVLPGVGAFGHCLEQLRARGFAEPIRDWLRAGKPFFGICVGYQALFAGSQESPAEPGLNFLSGQVLRFPSGGWQVPHMGWNTVQRVQGASTDKKSGQHHALWQGFQDEPYFYFVHSYYPELEEDSWAGGYTEYAGRRFASLVHNAEGTQLATQFHPEKSQHNGLRLLENWLRMTEAKA